ncbi:MAG TPA: glycosyltransferase [Methylomirabilota bacterium]|nr:glycosyltransferase [Methylomirabilota bacterium]
MRRFRVLHLIANRWWTGSADPALGLAHSLRGRGHDVAFACIRGDALEARALAVGLVPVDSLSLERTARPWVLLRDVRALRRLLRARRIEIVHAHLSHDHWLAAVAARGLPVVLVRTVHHRRAIRRGPALRWLFRRTGAVLAASEAIAEAAWGAGLLRARPTVVPGAVDVGRFSPRADSRPVRAELQLGTRPVVGSVARLVPGRGHDVLLRAAGRLRARFPALRVLLVGRGEGRPAVERLVRDLALEEVVIFAGYRDADLPQVLAAMDCFALLGGGAEESGRAVIEAMAAERPVVVGRFGAMPETVVDGETGWLVDPQPEAVMERLAAVFADPGRARAMGAAGRQRVLARFTPERRAVAVEEAYARALTGSA